MKPLYCFCNKAFSLAFAIFVLSAVSLPSLGVSTQGLFRPGGQNLFESVRANAPHFWSWCHDHASHYFATEILIEGQVSGDPHVLNFGYAFVQNHFQFALIDIDDLGDAPFVLDLVRYLAATHSMNPQISLEDIFKGYDLGLKGVVPKPLAFFKNEYVIKPDFHWKAFLRLPLLSQITLTQQKLYQKVEPNFLHSLGVATVAEVRFHLKTGGGSQNQPRFLLRILKDNQDQLFEFKMLAKPSTSYWNGIKAAAVVAENFRQTVYRPLVDDEFELITTPDGLFLKRQKLKYSNVIEDLVKNNTDAENLSEYALFVAQYLGYFHQAQSGSHLWAGKWATERIAVQVGALKMANDYLIELNRLRSPPFHDF